MAERFSTPTPKRQWISKSFIDGLRDTGREDLAQAAERRRTGRRGVVKVCSVCDEAEPDQ